MPGSSAVAAIVVVTIILSAFGTYYVTTSLSTGAQNQTIQGKTVVTSTVTTTSTSSTTVTVNQGQTIGNNAVLNMTYSSPCVSVDNSCSGSGYTIVFINSGDSLVSGGTIQIFFGNRTLVYGQTTCTFGSNILPKYTFTCSGSTPNNVPANSAILLSIVYPNGKTYSYVYAPPAPPSGDTLTSANLFAGTLPTTTQCSASGQAYISFAINNLGKQTSITRFALTGSSLNGNIITANYLSGSSCTSISASGEPTMSASSVTPITLYFSSSASGILASGQTYNFIIDFANGQSISGTLIAQ